MSSRIQNWFIFSTIVLMSCMIFSCKSNNNAKEATNKEVENDTIAEVDSIAADTLPIFADYDFMYFRGSKICFFSVENMDSLVYEGETDEIVNYEFLPGTFKLYYSVCKDSTMVLKYIDFASENPEPQEIVSWGLACKDCITETYGTYSGLRISDDGRYFGVNYDFSWDGYWFTKIKVYDNELHKFVTSQSIEKLYSYFESSSNEEEAEDEKENNDITYNSFYEAGADDDDGESEGSSYNYYYGSEGSGVCLTNKMKFESTPEEFELSGISPNGDRVVFGAILGWGDFPHGPFCVASLDGKMQVILEGTDLSYDEGPSMAWLEDGTFLYVRNFMEDVENFVPTIMAITSDSKEPVEVVKAPVFIMVPKVEND